MLDWLALWKHWSRLNWFSKPAVLLALIAWFSTAGGWQAGLFWFGLALIFSLIGDILLLNKRFFLAGLFAFLLAHIFYIFGFNPTSIPLELPSMIAVAVIWLGALLFYRRLRDAVHDRPDLGLIQLPLLAYVLAISIMLLSAISTWARPNWPAPAALAVSAGALLFAASDSLLATNRFIVHIPRGQLWVRILYHLGQLGLVMGILSFAAH